MSEVKNSKFDRWLTIALTIISGLHILSFVGVILSFHLANQVLDTSMNAAIGLTGDDNASGQVARGMYETLLEPFTQLTPNIILILVIGHVVSAVIFGLMAYVVVKQLTREE